MACKRSNRYRCRRAANVAGAELVLNDSETIGSLAGGGALGGNVNLNANGLTVGDANNTTYAGVISGPGGTLTKNGTGRLTLSGANTFTGGATLNAGALAIGDDAALGTGTLAVNGGALEADGGPRTVANAVNVNADFTVSGTQALDLSGPVDLGGYNFTVNRGRLDLSGDQEGKLVFELKLGDHSRNGYRLIDDVVRCRIVVRVSRNRKKSENGRNSD